MGALCGSATRCYFGVTKGATVGVMPINDRVPGPVIVIPGLSGAAKSLGVACTWPSTFLGSGRYGSGGYLARVVGTKVLDVSTQPNSWLNDITCPTSSKCVAVGGTSSSFDKSVVVTIDP